LTRGTCGRDALVEQTARDNRRGKKIEPKGGTEEEIQECFGGVRGMPAEWSI